VKARAADAADAASQRAPRPLVYVSDTSPGLRRLRRGKGFVYCLPDGQVLRDAEHISRIRRLAIPPAYTQVWICPLPHGHLQATGRDARGRKQYRYHADWRSAREASKFERLQEFGLVVRADLTKVHGTPVAQGDVEVFQTGTPDRGSLRPQRQ